MTYVYNSQLDAFTLYHKIREENDPKPILGPALPALGHAASGALGTAVSKLMTYPLDLLITRLQLQDSDEDAEYKGVLDAVEKIYNHEGGISAFYSGVIPETIKGVVDSFLFFLAYTYARERRLTSQETSRLSTLDEIGVGVAAGAFAKFWTTPLQNIVTRKQAAAMISARDPTSTPAKLSIREISSQIRKEKGLQGFWSGYSATLILTLNPSITFLLHRVFFRLLVPSSRKSDPGARVTFLLAAISKACASTLTYPFSLAKTRAQVSSQKPTKRSGPTSEKEDPTESIVEEKIVHARQRTVISTIIRIAQTEGISALYQGLGAEILKAFFSHGITMLAKERIHTLIINLYYLVLKSLQKYPGPEELKKMASDQAKDTYETASKQAKDVYAKGVGTVETAATKTQDAVVSGRQQAEEVYEKSKHAAGDAATKAQNAMSDGSKKAGELLEKGKDAASDAARNASTSATDFATKAQVKDINGKD